MLTRFSVSNYRSFKEKITVDFSKVGGYQYNQECLTGNLIGKMLIFGRNAVGKTNLGWAITDIALPWRFAGGDSSYVNADSSGKAAAFEYVFQFGPRTVAYRYSKAAEVDLLTEALEVDDKEVFSCDYEAGRYSFDGLEIVGAETAITDRFVEARQKNEKELDFDFKLSFLQWLFNNVVFSGGSVLVEMSHYISNMQFMSNLSVNGIRPKRMYQRFFERLSENEELEKFESFMNAMGVDERYRVKKLPDGTWELYCVHKRLIPFYENASSGAIALMNLYRRLVVDRRASFIFLDEFDAFYHYEMANKLLKFFCCSYPRCQIIFTTHNTNLMTNRLVRPDCVSILSGGGRLTPLCEATSRELREGHNLEKMYVSGEFVDYE